MSNVERTVIVKGEATGFQNMMDILKRSGSDLYEGLVEDAKKYTDNLLEQQKITKELLDQAEQRFKQSQQQRRLQSEVRAEERLKEAPPWLRPQIERKIEEEKAQVRQGEERQKVVIGEARRRQREEEFEARVGDGRGGRNLIQRARDTGASIGRSLLSGLAMATGIGAAVGTFKLIETAFEEGTQLMRARAGLRAITGRDELEGGLFGATRDIGVTRAERAQLGQQIVRARGVAGGDLMQDINQQMFAERAMTLERGALTNLSVFQRAGARSPSEILQDLLNISMNSKLFNLDPDVMPTKQDFSAIPEKLELIRTLLEQEQMFFEEFSGRSSIGLVSAFGSLGGAWEGRLQGQMIQGIQRGLTQPGNEHVQAIINQAIARTSPGGGTFLTQLQKRRQGVFAPGLFAETLRMAQEAGGGPGTEETQTILAMMFEELQGMPPKALARLAGAKPEEFRDVEAKFKEMGIDVKGGRRLIDDATVKAMAEAFTPVSDKIAATMKDALAITGESAINAAAPFIKTGIDGMLEVTQNIYSFLSGGGEVFDPREDILKKINEEKDFRKKLDIIAEGNKMDQSNVPPFDPTQDPTKKIVGLATDIPLIQLDPRTIKEMGITFSNALIDSLSKTKGLEIIMVNNDPTGKK